MIRARINERPTDRRGDKRDFVIITSASGWGRFYAQTPELRRPVAIVHPHRDFRMRSDRSRANAINL